MVAGCIPGGMGGCACVMDILDLLLGGSGIAALLLTVVQISPI